MRFISDILPYLSAGILLILLYSVLAELWHRVRGERISWLHRLLRLALGVNLLLVFLITIPPGSGLSFGGIRGTLNLIPFRVLETVGENPWNFFGNILMFMPFGAFLVLFSNRCGKLRITALTGSVISVAIEVLQLFTLRGTDIDDVILNTIGTCLGYFVGRCLIAAIPRLGKGIGIIKNADGRDYRKMRDTAGVKALVLFTLAFVLVLGVFESDFQAAPTGARLRLDAGLSLNTVLSPDAGPSSDDTDLAAFTSLSVEAEAQYVYVLHTQTNSPLYEKSGDVKTAPASTAKLLTALTVLDYCGLTEVVTAGTELALVSPGSSLAWLNMGDSLTIRQLLAALLLPSGNDAAYTLAVHAGRVIAGDGASSNEDAVLVFVDKMNKKAAALGAASSKFLCPDGYDMEGQYTTARDLACIAAACLENEALLEIMGSYRISDTWASGREVTYYSTNELINPESAFYYPNAVGLKTGNTKNAGSCLVSAAVIGGQTYVCVVMGASEEGRWTDSLRIYRQIEKIG